MLVEHMKVSDLSVNYNAREVDNDLVDSINVHGIKTPLIVYEDGGKTFIKDGHRRMAAARSLEFEYVPVVRVDCPESNATGLVDQYIINNERKPMTYLETAKVYQTLVDYGWKQAEVSDTLGVNKSEVSLALASLRAHPKVQGALEDGKISPSAVEPLLSLDEDTQARLIDVAVREKTVRKVRALVLADKKMQSMMGSEVVEDYLEEEVGSDPNDVMTITALDEALAYMSAIKAKPILDKELRTRGRLNVRELIDIATRLQDVL